MAGETHLSSDSGDTFISDVPERHKRFMRSKLVDSLLDTEDFAVQILHTEGQPAQMILNFATNPGKTGNPVSMDVFSTEILL